MLVSSFSKDVETITVKFNVPKFIAHHIGTFKEGEGYILDEHIENNIDNKAFLHIISTHYKNSAFSFVQMESYHFHKLGAKSSLYLRNSTELVDKFDELFGCGRNFQDMYVFDATDSNTEPSLFDEAEHTYLFSTEWFGGELKRTTQISKWFLNYLGGYPVIIQVMQRKNIKGNDVADEDFTQIRLFMAKRDLENIYLAMENDKWSKPTVYKVMVYEP